ncbi:nucleoside recognition domain-containing protein [Mucilaginibacter sp. KACC 22063]|uniref:nucleoside recognition domain-containing protein n=1 Tax=Mucilaginibacter sp. KACC 22063 TaxID=3025666 RepID=UPI0023654D3C|nr:nucleoside recognition domain-containing protein [Mucilaginibacter sp. KACC 22063]WDF53637.1 nucleoside recognition domain-containing protein [Mucilaginibacter sp. KACC 22063]
MALNYIWIAFFVIAFVVGLVKLIFLGDTEIFRLMVEGLFDTTKASVMDFALPLAGTMAFWLGIMNVGEKAGAINLLSRIVGPFFSRLFPEVPKDHPANGAMLMNYSANLLGLDSAATPLGIKAMASLQELNPDKERASNAQVMFMVLHASGLTLLPVGVITQRFILHSKDPSDIFIPIIIVTYVSTLTGLILVAIKQRINLFDKVILAWLGGLTLFIGGVVYYFAEYLSKSQIGEVSKVFSNVMMLAIPTIFVIGGLYKKVNVFETFIEGAKGGFETAIRIIPYLVGLLAAISLIRTCGVLDWITEGFRYIFHLFLNDTRFVDALPVVLIRPMSGQAARAMMIVLMKPNPDNFIGHLASVLYGSSDTIFYIVALYFGSVGIKKTRYVVPISLFGDLVGVIVGIFICYLFFG